MGRRTVVGDPTAKLQAEAAADPEDDNLEGRLIEQERKGAEHSPEGFPND
jgi:hypothetical protein